MNTTLQVDILDELLLNLSFYRNILLVCNDMIGFLSAKLKFNGLIISRLKSSSELKCLYVKHCQLLNTSFLILP